jgi:hypothetical protein
MNVRHLDGLTEHVRALRRDGRPFIVGGDFNAHVHFGESSPVVDAPGMLRTPTSTVEEWNARYPRRHLGTMSDPLLRSAIARFRQEVTSAWEAPNRGIVTPRGVLLSHAAVRQARSEGKGRFGPTDWLNAIDGVTHPGAGKPLDGLFVYRFEEGQSAPRLTITSARVDLRSTGSDHHPLTATIDAAP